MLVEAIVGLLTVGVIVYLWLTWHWNYWAKHGVPYIRPNLIFGNLKDIALMKQNIALTYDELYWKEPDAPAVGVFNMRQPQLLVRNPELVKMVLIKEFNSFHDNCMYVDSTVDPIVGNNPFITRGENWKISRAIHTPAFTTIKLKTMMPLMGDVSKDMIEFLSKNVDVPLEAKCFSGQYTIDVVASCVFGVSSCSFKDPNAVFRKKAAKVFNPDFRTNFAFLTAHYLPSVSTFLRLKFLPSDVAQFFGGVIKDTMVYRKQNGITRNDFLQQMIQESESKGYTQDQITSFCMTFFFDGYETSSILISYLLYLLAIHPEVQEKLREEIKSNIPDPQKVDFDVLTNLPYLEAVISETLRIYPPGTVMTKLCTKDITLHCEGQDYPMKQGQTVALPIFSMHRDPKYFPNPEDFLPERFYEKSGHPAGYFPFGLGPRACLGMRFALTQTKMGTAQLLHHFEILPREDFPKTLEFDPMSSVLLIPKGGLWIKFRPLKRTN